MEPFNLTAAIQSIPDEYISIKNRLLSCLLYRDLNSIRIYTAGLIDMGNISDGPADLMAQLVTITERTK